MLKYQVSPDLLKWMYKNCKTDLYKEYVKIIALIPKYSKEPIAVYAKHLNISVAKVHRVVNKFNKGRGEYFERYKEKWGGMRDAFKKTFIPFSLSPFDSWYTPAQPGDRFERSND